MPGFQGTASHSILPMRYHTTEACGGCSSLTIWQTLLGCQCQVFGLQELSCFAGLAIYSINWWLINEECQFQSIRRIWPLMIWSTVAAQDQRLMLDFNIALSTWRLCEMWGKHFDTSKAWNLHYHKADNELHARLVCFDGWWLLYNLSLVVYSSESNIPGESSHAMNSVFLPDQTVRHTLVRLTDCSCHRALASTVSAGVRQTGKHALGGQTSTFSGFLLMREIGH